jgi:hypothetical protein
MGPEQVVDRAAGQAGRGRAGRGSGHSQPVIVDDERQGTGDTGPATLEDVRLIDQVQLAGPHLGLPVGRGAARDASELERYGKPFRSGDPQLLRSPLDLDAGASGEQEMRAGSQIPPLQAMPEVGTRGVDGNQLWHFDAADEFGDGV